VLTAFCDKSKVLLDALIESEAAKNAVEFFQAL
jgi:hypothetical protein